MTTEAVHPKCPPFFCRFSARILCKFSYFTNSKLTLGVKSLSLLSLWGILFQIKLGLFRENLNLKKHLQPKNGWSSPSTFWHSLYIYEPVTKGHDLKWDTLPQNQTPSKLFSVLPLESGMFQVTISIIKKWFWSKCVLYGIKTGVRSGVDVCNNGHSECHNNTEKNHLYAILMLLVHLSSC